jgi:polyisoprenoid-binding protein YceI
MDSYCISVMGRLAWAGTLVLAGLLMLTPAHAVIAGGAAWTIAPGDSQVGFGFERNGKAAEGVFRRFEGSGTFDAAAPGEATLEMRIESASIDLGDRTASDFATSAEYFDSANHPLVTYRLLSLTPAGDGQYMAEGELSIRGWPRKTESRISLNIQGDTAQAKGALTILRKDFFFGVGPTSLFVNLGPEITVSFDLTAHRAP